MFYDFVEFKLGVYFEEVSTKTVWIPVRRIIGKYCFSCNKQTNKLLTISWQNLRLETSDLTFFSTMGLVSKIAFGSSCENLLVFSI